MPLLRSLEEEFAKTKPFDGIRITVSVHLEAKTAYLAKLFAIGGGQVSVTGSNPLSTRMTLPRLLRKTGLMFTHGTMQRKKNIRNI